MEFKYNIGDKVLYRDHYFDDTIDETVGSWIEDEIWDIDQTDGAQIPYLLKSDVWADDSQLKPFEQITNLFKFC